MKQETAVIVLVLAAVGAAHGARLAPVLLDQYTVEEALLEDVLASKRAAGGGDSGFAGESEANSLWFGPRLGRRRRSPPDESDFAEEQMSLAELVRDAPWALLAIKADGGKRQTLALTPRLGRELDARGSPPFSPRLGRTSSTGGLPFSPRLGRQQEAHHQ